jgi:hypothetical protein
MAVGLVLEFTGQTREQYETVGRHLGIDLLGGVGDWPDGLLSHAAGAGDSGWSVMEVWASRADQERFLEGRLRAALDKAGVQGPPAREDWIELTTYHTPVHPDA